MLLTLRFLLVTLAVSLSTAQPTTNKKSLDLKWKSTKSKPGDEMCLEWSYVPGPTKQRLPSASNTNKAQPEISNSRRASNSDIYMKPGLIEMVTRDTNGQKTKMAVQPSFIDASNKKLKSVRRGMDPPEMAMDPPGMAMKPPGMAMDPPRMAMDPPTMVMDPPAMVMDPPAMVMDPPAMVMDRPAMVMALKKRVTANRGDMTGYKNYYPKRVAKTSNRRGLLTGKSFLSKFGRRAMNVEKPRSFLPKPDQKPSSEWEKLLNDLSYKLRGQQDRTKQHFEPIQAANVGMAMKQWVKRRFMAKSHGWIDQDIKNMTAIRRDIRIKNSPVTIQVHIGDTS